MVGDTMSVIMEIEITKPTKEVLEKLQVETWGIWEKEVSTFPWEYDDKETCYILEGKVTVTTDKGAVSFGKGDLVVFPKGPKCTWDIKERVRKYYRFG